MEIKKVEKIVDLYDELQLLNDLKENIGKKEIKNIDFEDFNFQFIDWEEFKELKEELRETFFIYVDDRIKDIKKQLKEL